MANLGNTIINGALRVNGKINSSDVISAPSFTGALTGNADTATKLANARTINDISFNGSANITIPYLKAIDLRGAYKPSNVKSGYISSVFSTLGGLDGNASDNKWVDVIGLSTWGDNGGNGVNALVVTKRTTEGQAIYHYYGDFGATTWKSKKQIAYTDSSITGNAATATKLATARTINGVSFDGSGNITTANWGTARNVTIQDSTAAHSGTAVSVNGSGNINLKLPATISASLSGNASTATKLQTARNIAVTGSVSGNANFDGSANINISVNRKGATVGQGGSTNTKPWYKVASLSQKSGNNDNHIMFSVYSTYADASTKVGILKIHLRTTGDGKWSSSDIVWLSKSNNISVSDFVLAHNTNVNPTVVELWCKCNQGYQGYNFDVISEGYRVGRNSEWTMYNTWTVGSQDAPTNGYTQQTSTLLTLANPISGNAATATKLQTARTIGVSGVTGTAQSFNGTANIVIPITAVPSTLLTNKSAIKGSEITNDKHWIPSSDASVTNFVSMTAEEYATNASSLATGTIVAITDGVEGYVTTQATSLTCDLPLDL